MNREEKITISVNEEDVQNIINAYEKDIEYINQLEKENKRLKEIEKEHQKMNGELREENQKLKKQLEYLRSGEYLNQLKFERNMLEDIVQNTEVSKEDKEFIDMTHRNTELLEENQELKRKLNEAIHKATEFESEVYELEKQLENYKKLGFKHLQDKNNNLETQQKDFIEYMNKTIKELECDDVDDEEIKGYLIQRIDTFKEILSKYNEIIGDDK